MTDRDPEPNNPLSPYYPSEVPDIPGGGRHWVAILIALLIATWLIASLLRLAAATL